MKVSSVLLRGFSLRPLRLCVKCLSPKIDFTQRRQGAKTHRVKLRDRLKVKSLAFGFLPIVAAVASLMLFAAGVSAQTRDHLTDAEGELIRFHRELDKRIEVLIKAADRRFAILNGLAQPATKKLMKDEPDWGDIPKGSRAELLGDIAGILDEAINNIDDVSRRDERNPLISRSLRKLTAATTGYLNQLVTLRNKATDAGEIAAIERLADNANQIIDAGGKLPAAAPEDKKKKKP